MFFSFCQFLRPRPSYYRMIEYKRSLACALIIMSHISSSKKIRSWKISDNSRVYPSEESIRDPKSVLPEKFSPAKNSPRPSKIFTASKEKLGILRGERSPREANLTPSKRQVVVLGSHLSLKESGGLLQSPKQVRTERGPELQSRESLVLRNLESDSPSPRRKGVSEINYHLLKSQQDFNLQTIHQLRIDFITFKSQVWAQLVQQKDAIARIAAEMTARIDLARMPLGDGVYSSSKEGQAMGQLKNLELARQVEEVGGKVEEVGGKFEEVGGQFEQFSSQIEKKYSELKLDCIEASPPASPDAKELAECRTPIEKLEVERVPERRSTPLDKCNQIVETIGILSEINSSPVGNKTRSIEKLSIEEYKQKLISVSRSNDQLMRDPQRQAGKARQEGKGREEGKLKGSFKLDKFYNAIEKLKEEVNEIRNINEMKQIKKLRILKVQQ